MNNVSELKKEVEVMWYELSKTKNKLEYHAVNEGMTVGVINCDREDLTPLVKMHNELLMYLMTSIAECQENLQDHRSELILVEQIQTQNKEKTHDIIQAVLVAIQEAIEDAEKTIVDAKTLQQAYTKFYNGTEGLKKRLSKTEPEVSKVDIKDKVAQFEYDIYNTCACGINKSACSYHK